MNGPSSNWGIRPVLFQLGAQPVSSYAVFMLLGLCVGIAVYLREALRQGAVGQRTFLIFLAAVLGGALGAKIPVVLYALPELSRTGAWSAAIASGRSVVGGLVGGALAVTLVKRWLRIKERRGHLLAPGIAAGVAVGRVGCFLNGCCYGTPTRLPWAVDFGDGVPRHPTQLYESLFMLAMWGVLVAVRRRLPRPGGLFVLLMCAYFPFRFLTEFIRVEGPTYAGLTYYQWLSLPVMLWYGWDLRGLLREPIAAESPEPVPTVPQSHL